MVQDIIWKAEVVRQFYWESISDQFDDYEDVDNEFRGIFNIVTRNKYSSKKWQE